MQSRRAVVHDDLASGLDHFSVAMTESEMEREKTTCSTTIGGTPMVVVPAVVFSRSSPLVDFYPD